MITKDSCWQCGKTVSDEGWCRFCNMFPDDVCQGCNEDYDVCECGARNNGGRNRARSTDWS